MKHSFGGAWTEDKLSRLREYLRTYMVIFRKHPGLVPVYVDAFAGTGYRKRTSGPDSDQLPFVELGQADKAFLKGSAHIALETEPPFAKYIFVELNKRHARELLKLKTTFKALAGRISIVREDANAFLQRWCAEMDWTRLRAVVFLDPYGMQVEWPTIECLARTGAVDLWYLFPLSAVNRLLTKGGRPRDSWVEKLNRIYGSPGWFDVFYPKRRIPTLFGEDEVTLKDADFKRIAEFTVQRLRTVFPAVAGNPRVLMNEKNSPLFLLCFAAASTKESVQRAALNIASHILKM